MIVWTTNSLLLLMS